MPKSNNSVASRKRRKKILKLARGYYGAKRRSYTMAKNAVEKSFLNSYIGRKNKKKNFRKLWIIRINAYVRRFSNLSYSKFIHILRKKKYKLNRKILAHLMIECKNNLINKILKN